MTLLILKPDKNQLSNKLRSTLKRKASNNFAFVKSVKIILNMGVIFLLIACSVFVAIIFLIAFLWGTKSGQFEDGYTPSVRMLFDDTVNKKKESNK